MKRLRNAFLYRGSTQSRNTLSHRQRLHRQRGEVVIVDEFTGRLLEGRRFSEGLHQAIEAKET